MPVLIPTGEVEWLIDFNQIKPGFVNQQSQIIKGYKS